MCTAVKYVTKDHYFGRSLDLDRSYGEQIVIVPRNLALRMRRAGVLERHFALIGMALVADGCPLFFDATNEMGLSMAGLNFPGYAGYHPEAEGKDNVAPFELIQWILAQCKSVAEARRILERVNIVNISFSSSVPLSPLHWMIADRTESIVVESMREGLNVYDNPVGVLTNNPPFDMQLFNLNNYMHLTAKEPENLFWPGLELSRYSLGMGALGLPGDLSSMSRFVRAAFALKNSAAGASEEESVSQFFHILGFVSQIRGLTDPGGGYHFTQYTSCCNAARGIYYYTTYDNSRITGVDMHRENLDGDRLWACPQIRQTEILMQNQG